MAHVPLAGLTTLRVGGPAAGLVPVETEEELAHAVDRADRGGGPVLLLGGGSNVVVADEGFDGTVVLIRSRGVRITACGDDEVLVDVAAGEPWDALVERTVTEGLAGMEALSGIPGSTGATPIQNVGAYGQDVSQTVAAVRVWDRRRRDQRVLHPWECRFAYRHSRFKGQSGHVILGVAFRLRRAALGTPVHYAELARALGVGVGDQAPLAEVREAVLRLRRAKGMVLDAADHDTWSAGSFFTNPVLDDARSLPAEAPRYPDQDDRVKTSAAWLIEQAGFSKGYGQGPARVSTKHTLALTNRGEATAADVLALAREIQAGVRGKFGVRLAPEPVLVGTEL